MWHSRPPRDPHPFMANAILNFHFDFLTPSLITNPSSPIPTSPIPIHQHPFNKIQVIGMKADRTLGIYVNLFQNTEILILILTFF